MARIVQAEVASMVDARGNPIVFAFIPQGTISREGETMIKPIKFMDSLNDLNLAIQGVLDSGGSLRARQQETVAPGP